MTYPPSSSQVNIFSVSVSVYLSINPLSTSPSICLSSHSSIGQYVFPTIYAPIPYVSTNFLIFAWLNSFILFFVRLSFHSATYSLVCLFVPADTSCSSAHLPFKSVYFSALPSSMLIGYLSFYISFFWYAQPSIYMFMPIRQCNPSVWLSIDSCVAIYSFEQVFTDKVTTLCAS